MTNLAEWLASEHDLSERLELIDNLCRALAGFHAREPRVRPALDPASIALTPESDVTLSVSDPRESGEQVPEYRAPETVAGAPYDPAVDSYSVGVLCYEILAGRHPFVLATPLGDIEAAADVPPPPLAEVRPDLPRELAEAIMPCLERDPEWRPRDLSYLVETLRKARRTLPAAPRRRAPVKAPAALEAPGELPFLRRPAKPASSRLPLMAASAAGLVVVLGGLWFLTRPQPARHTLAAVAPPSSSTTPPPEAVPPAGASAPGTTRDVDRAEDAPLPATAPTPRADPPAATPTPQREVVATLPPEAPAPRPSALPSPLVAAATPWPQDPARAAAPPTPNPPAPRPQPTRAERQEPAPEPAAPAHPAVVTTLVPARLRRGATILIDVRGSDLRADLQPRILFKGRESAAGVQPVGQRLVNPTWLKVMLKIDAQAREGSYTLALGDALGNVSNAHTFEIGR